MKWVVFSLLIVAMTLVAPPRSAAAAVRIGNEARLQATTDQEYFSSMNRMPASNSVQRLNPPVFQWMYYEDPKLLATTGAGDVYIQTRVFNFQLTTNGSFASPLWNYTVSNNFYNFFPPITNADGSTFTGTVSWRIRYMNSNNSVVMGTSPAHTFTMPANAEIWDRSCFADKAYLNSFSNVHPRIFVKATNLTAFRSFVQGPNLSQVIPNVNLAVFTNTASILKSPLWTANANTLTNQFPGWVFLASSIAEMGVAYWGVTDPWFTNAINSASPSVASVLTNWAVATETANYDRIEAYGGNLYGLFGLAVSYDSFYHLLNDSQRAMLRRLMRNWAAFYVFEDWYYTGSTPNTDRVYGNKPLAIHYPSIAKQGESHMRHDRAALMLCLAGLGEDDMFGQLLEYYLSYYIARFDPYGLSGEDPRIYGGISTILDYDRSFQPWVMANMMFYDKKLTNAPVYNELADVIMFHTPTGHRVVGNPWGQVSCYCENIFAWNQNPWQYTAFAVHAAMQGRGDYYRQHLRASDVTLGGGRIGESPMLQAIATPFYWPAPTQTDRNTNSFIDPVRGWAVGLSGNPTDWDVYSNQVGFVFQARPTGTGRNSGGMFSDGQIEMWAYGATLTAAGGGYFSQAALMHNGLFVDGVGVNNANPAITFPIHARIDAYTNWGDGLLVRGDLTRAFNLSNYVGGGVGNLQSVQGSAAVHNYMQASNARPYISSIKRSILMPHKRYLVIYDELATTRPAQFQWKWNALPTNCTAVNPSTMSFNYSVTNNFPGRPNVSVYVQHIVNPSLMGVTQMANTFNPPGSNALCYALMNPFTGENYAGTNNWRVGPIEEFRYWANTIWIYNKAPTTNWHFMSVVYPVKSGETAPTITRLDDYTVQVQKDGEDDVISFDPNTSQPANYIIALTGGNPVLIRPSKVRGIQVAE